jgi:hypothetical protein
MVAYRNSVTKEEGELSMLDNLDSHIQMNSNRHKNVSPLLVKHVTVVDVTCTCTTVAAAPLIGRVAHVLHQSKRTRVAAGGSSIDPIKAPGTVSIGVEGAAVPAQGRCLVQKSGIVTRAGEAVLLRHRPASVIVSLLCSQTPPTRCFSLIPFNAMTISVPAAAASRNEYENAVLF